MISSFCSENSQEEKLTQCFLLAIFIYQIRTEIRYRKEKQMKIEDVIVMFFGIGLSLLVGILIINMITGFLSEGGLIFNFFSDLIEIVIGQIKSLII